MKKLLFFVFTIMMSAVSIASSHIKRIEKLAQPYEQAIEFIVKLDTVRQIQEHDIFLFFNTNDLHERKNIRKLNRAVSHVKKLVYSKKSSLENMQEVEHLVNNLEKVQKFVVEYASTYYALVVCHEITAFYYYIDEQNQFVASIIANQSEKLGLPSMKGRGLYKFVKKIDLDLRRLTALFAQNIMTDNLALKANQIKTKLVVLRSKIVESSEYKTQVLKTRFLKALGVMTPFIAVITGAVLSNCVFSSFAALELCITLPLILGASAIVTGKEMRESTKYNIPVHSTSVFSLFMPICLPLTWIPRG